MIPKLAKQEIMELASEDCTPFFDITGVVSHFMPGVSAEEHIVLARTYVRELLAKGYVTVQYDCFAKHTATHRHTEDLTPTQIEMELEDSSNWRYHKGRPPDERWVTIYAEQEALGKFYTIDFAQ